MSGGKLDGIATITIATKPSDIDRQFSDGYKFGFGWGRRFGLHDGCDYAVACLEVGRWLVRRDCEHCSSGWSQVPGEQDVERCKHCRGRGRTSSAPDRVDLELDDEGEVVR